MSNDEMLTKPAGSATSWQALETRVNRLLENIILLRDINSQLKKENESLKAQLKIINDSGTSRELDKLRNQYDEAIQDLRQVKQNLQHIESLASELKLEGY